MAGFTNIPVEVTPEILQFILKPSHLALAALINKTFYAYAMPLLYKRTAIFAWFKDGKKKAMILLSTLADCPHLARYVRALELRDFPKSILQRLQGRNEEILTTCLRAIYNCSNLRSLVWTRDGTLNSAVLEELSQCPNLESLEINGHHNHSFDPLLLLKFSNLRKLSVIMPSPEVIKVFPPLLLDSNNSLDTLALICKSSPVVTDDFLLGISPALSHLRSLSLAGCPKVTHQGIKHVLDVNVVGIRELSLEGLSSHFDTKVLHEHCLSRALLERLESVTMALPLQSINSAYLLNVDALLSQSPVRKFNIYATGSRGRNGILPHLQENFVRSFISKHHHHLLRFAVLRFPISIAGLEFVVKHSKLEELFVAIRRSDLPNLGYLISHAPTLRSLHVNYGLESFISAGDDDSDGEQMAQVDLETPFPTKDELLQMAKQFKPSLTQFGVQTRVWQVQRSYSLQEDGSFKILVDLTPYESPDVPGVFLVIRT